MNDTTHKTLEVEVLNIHKGEYLSEALKRQGYPMLPSNAIINKVMTGTGATYMELNPKLSPRNSIVIEPYRSAVENKVQAFDEVQGVFKEVTVKKLTAYLNNSNIKYKKIITTPEGFQTKVLKAAKSLKMNIYKEFFNLYDESEHITEDTDYRRSISSPMKEFFKFEGKALVSATPLKPSKYTLTLFLRHQFKWIEIKPDYDYREDMTLITTRSFYSRVKQEVKRLLDNGSPHVCIFYKTTEGICNIVESLPLTNTSLSETQFAQIVGRMRMFQALSPARQKAIPRLLITDSQINSVCRDYYHNEVFGAKDNAISMFDFHNLLTQANKGSYIDTYLQRAVNATEVSVGINNVLQGLDNKYAWFLG